MSSPKHNELAAKKPAGDDDPMQGSGQEEEGEGEDVGMENVDDSSEEEEEDEEEVQRVIEGFIVDEVDEEDDEDEGPKKRRKRRKSHHRRQETLEEDDFELLAENTRGLFKKKKKKNRLSRLRHRSNSPASKRHTVVDSSEDDLSTGEQPRVIHDISKIWDDDRRGEDEDEDIDDFIEYSDEDVNEAAREARREEKRLELRRKRTQVRPELVGIDANAWDELHEVFGDGHEYDWALAADDEVEREEEQYRPDMTYRDVFEPSEIKKRKLTEDDHLIRAMDTPERMQLVTSSLAENSTLSIHTQLTEEDIGGAAMWVSQRLSQSKKEKFFTQDGDHHHLSGDLVMAVTFVLRQLFVEEYEVPYIWTHKRDYIFHFDDPPNNKHFDLLELEELWLVYSLGQKYRSLLERRRALASLYQRLQVHDPYYDKEVEPHLDSVEIVADATEWLSLKYKDRKQDHAAEFRFHDDEEPELEKKRKMPSRVSAYEVAKKSIVVKLVEKFGLQSHQIVQNFNEGRHVHFAEDFDVNPIACAEQFLDPDPVKAQTPEDLLKRARLILSTELGKDPLLRNHVRSLFREEARLTVEPTDRGIYKIEESHPFFVFKYLRQKPVANTDSPQFLHILEAEKENLVTVSLTIPSDVKVDLERKLKDAFSSDNFTEAAKAWNAERSLVIQEALEQHLIPAGVKWIREVLRDEAEDYVANICGNKLRNRINERPYSPADLRPGESACSVLVISWGKGDPHKDAITLVYLDEAGRLRDHTKVDNLDDQDNLDEFLFLLDRRKPEVAVVGGFSIATLKLRQRVKEVLRGTTAEGHGWGHNSKAFDIPVLYVHDDVARIYQHSKRAAQEFSALSPTAKYCVGLARYIQNPLNEFAALGSDITAISFDEDNQNLVPKDKLFFALEQALVDVTNQVGVEINRAVTDPYYQQLLPFVCGLGPRKAEVLIKKIGLQGGVLLNRDQFIKGGLLTTKIFLNAAGFLRISHQGGSSKSSRNHPSQHEDAPDPLDDTRIHPEDYELARKMAMDALELDEEDIHNEHPSHVVTLLMQDNARKVKLDELNLDEFATSLYEANHDQKRFTLNVIRNELGSPFAETRNAFKLPDDKEILTMLTGETTKTFGVGLIVSALVYRIQRDRVFVRLDSGFEGSITVDQLSDQARNAFDIVKKGQAITAIVTELTLKLVQDDFYELELSGKAEHLQHGDAGFRRGAQPDEDYWDRDRLEKDKEMLQRKKRAENERSRRVIKHPNFHNLSSAEAETYLEKQQRGDVVIRPSSKGTNHLAVTWKVDDKLYQHLDVTELNNNDPTGHTVGGTLIVDPKHRYSDLDELIVNHVQAMARRVEELMAHEKFKHGPEDDLHVFLKNYVTANPSKSMYGFTLNRKRPGHFSLCFLANKNSTVQTWPVRVAPEAYYLFDAPAVGVPELCDAFKVRHLHESQNYASAAASGRTPFGAGMRTPARPGGTTPGHMSIHQVSRTPNPYVGGQTPFVPPNLPPSNYGMPPPHPPPQPVYGYQPPVHPGFSGQPPSMPLWGPPSGPPSGNW